MVGLLEGHSSAIRGIGFSHDGATMVSGGRDKVVNVWDTSAKGQGRLRNAVPVFESLEALVVIGSTEAEAQAGETPLRFFTAGETGVVKLWDQSGKCLAKRDTGAAIYDAR